MGGDGGTISSNRTYLRGAGKACHTADHPSNALKRAKLEDAEQSRWTLTTCAISGAVLDLSPKKKGAGGGNTNSVCAVDIVACPYGKLYKHELVLEALLRRRQTGGGGEDDGDNGNEEVLGSHIRGMKDLHPVRFHVTTTTSSSSSAPSSSGGATNGGASSVPNNYIATCPITGSEIGSGNVPCFVIVRTKNKDKKKGASTSRDDDDDDEVANNPNVLSERAIKEMGVSGLQTEYGPFDEENMIRLAPPKSGGVFDDIQQKWILRMEEERIAKLKKKKKDKKRKRGGGEDNGGDPKVVSAIAKSSSSISSSKINGHSNNKGRSGVPTNHGKKSAVDEARSTVQSAVAHNPVLSNLFGTDKKKNGQSEKEKRVNLFTRNC